MGEFEVLPKTKIEPLLRRCGQEHLLRFWDELDAAGRARLTRQIQHVPWDDMAEWIKHYVLSTPELDVPLEQLSPAPYYPLTPRTKEERDLYDRAARHGAELLSSGAVAAFTAAGGQGTRLGYDGPKGTFPISPVKRKSLFQIFAETIHRAREKYGARIPWFIMTSPATEVDTRDYFTANDFFGLAPGDVRFLVQGTMPAVGLDGRLLLAAKDSLALSPNGHGGTFPALRDAGALERMRRDGIRHISYWQVDNPLVKPFDPLFVGLHDLAQSDMSCRALLKRDPSEKLGNFCVCQGATMIIEYSDMPEDLARETDDRGGLRFGAGSPAIHILSRSFVEELTRGGEVRLPFHRAVKKVPYVNASGDVVEPEQPNAVKLEMFIFDALPKARNVVILEADRNEQFGPVKNASGEDSPETSRCLLSERAARWLEVAGLAAPRCADGALDCVVELSPRRFLDREDVVEQAVHLAPPKRGEHKYYG